MVRTKSRARSAAQNKPRGIAGNMEELIRRFGTEEACERHMVSLRWPNGFSCPNCGCDSYARVRNRREFRCAHCSWQFSATSGTLLAHTKIPLVKWFRAAFLVCLDARGVSAQAVARECGVSDATGIQMLRRLRAAMGFAMRLCRVGGDWVEVDATNVSCGNTDGRMKAGTGLSDIPVMIAASGTEACARVLSNVTAGSVSEFCASHVSRLHEVRVDAHPSHGQALAGGWDIVVRPSAADGDSKESLPVVHHLMSNLKAQLAGTCHGVTCDRLQEHCDEFSWKYSHRLGDQMADLLRELVRWPHTNLDEIGWLAQRQPRHDRVRDAGGAHNWRMRAKKERETHEALVNVLASIVNRKSAALTHL